MEMHVTKINNSADITQFTNPTVNHVVWTQWSDLEVPEGFTKLSPETRDLGSEDLADITFYVPLYMGGKDALEHSRRMSSLKYLQLPNAGFDDAIEYLAPGVTLCNARGVHDASTAELGMGLAIAVRRGFSDFALAQQSGSWHHRRYPSLNDSKIAILGAGSIASKLKAYLQPYDVTVDLYSRSGGNSSLNISQFDTNISQYDIVFLLLPLNDDSRNFFNRDRLRSLKDSACIINLARGPIINTDALVEELNTGRIFAGLDVTDPEPLPAGHPLWSANNCIITPHVGGDSSAFEPRGKQLVKEQLARLAVGTKLINIVAQG
jgi:phosphoglycerate dehydrogenase-like enzyme